jgi:hypothetical protein
MGGALPESSGLADRVNMLVGLREAVRTRHANLFQEICSLEADSDLFDMVSSLFRSLIDREIRDSVVAVERLQSEGLQTVFDDQNLSVEGIVEVLRGKVSVEMQTLDQKADGTIVRGVAGTSFGGAVTTLQSILMRITILVKRGLRPILLLDEALPAINHEYVVNTGRFLETVCKRMGLDILLVTHNTVLVDAGHNPYRIRKGKNGEAILSRVREAV